MPPEVPTFDFRQTVMTERGLDRYVEDLEIPEASLHDPKAVILDLGSGTQQNFAKEMRERGYAAQVLSLDPRLSLREDEDVGIASTVRADRIQGRRHAEPNTVAGRGEALPLRSASLDSVFAYFSVPHYFEHPELIQQALLEIVRVTKPGGSIRTYPIEKSQVDVVKAVLSKLPNVTFSLQAKEEYPEEGTADYLLVIEKRK